MSPRSGQRERADALRAAAALGSRRRRRAAGSSRASPDRACARRRRGHCRHGRFACAPPTCTSANRPRSRPPTRRACWATPGSGRQARAARRSSSSSVTAADVPTPITSAHTRRRSLPAISTLIHRVWLDAVKAVGPHVHHHDVVRAALTANGTTTHRPTPRRRPRRRSASRPPRRRARGGRFAPATTPACAT